MTKRVKLPLAPKHLTVGELRAALSSVPDDTPVGVTVHDDDPAPALALGVHYDGKQVVIS